MSKLRCHISISLDGFVAGPNQSEENPLGEGGERLHDSGGSAGRLAPTPRQAGRVNEQHARRGGKDVMLWGGGQVGQQYLAAGLLDELELHVVPVVLGDGARLFDNLRDAEVQLEQVRAVEAPGVTHLKYRSVK